MRFIKLDRPLAVFDIESTGLNPRTDRILELAVIRLNTSGETEARTWLLNPTVPIPLETIAIHGITDELVKNCPRFADAADEIFAFFKGCDIGGFGIGKLDIPILEEEFARLGMVFDAAGRRQFDAMRIFHKREPRDLSAAVKFYCGAELQGAHGAEADAAATLDVLRGQFEKYPDLPENPDELDKLLNERDPFFVDREGRLRWLDGEVAINFGKRKGEKICDLILGSKDDKNYLKWILNSDFPDDTKAVVRNALEGKWPKTPAVTPTSQPAAI
jgi:DNA polymerase III, epsilon subunit and related 3''-5'' exonucleases